VSIISEKGRVIQRPRHVFSDPSAIHESDDQLVNATIGHIKDEFLPASETFIYSLISGLSGYRSVVLNRHARQNVDLFPFSEHYSPHDVLGRMGSLAERASLRLLGRSPYLERAARIEQVRILHAHFGHLGALFVPVARRLDVPLITSFYGMDTTAFMTHPAWRKRFERLWQHGARALVLGPAMAQRLRESGCPEESISVLPIAIDMEKFTFRRRTPPPGDGPICILSVGRLVPLKGMDVLLRAAAALRPRRSLRIWIAGDGPERGELERLSRELGLAEVVSFIGWIRHSDMSALMNRAHLFVLASRTDPSSAQIEGTPTVLLEAQAMGLPVISTYHSDIPFIVRHDETGLLVPEADDEALGAALERLIRCPERWPSLGSAGREAVERTHARPVVAARLGDVYAGCLGKA
jgi:colanic acid/amylovoran biosynthesis glycosyltransferase